MMNRIRLLYVMGGGTKILSEKACHVKEVASQLLQGKTFVVLFAEETTHLIDGHVMVLLEWTYITQAITRVHTWDSVTFLMKLGLTALTVVDRVEGTILPVETYPTILIIIVERYLLLEPQGHQFSHLNHNQTIIPPTITSHPQSSTTPMFDPALYAPSVDSWSSTYAPVSHLVHHWTHRLGTSTHYPIVCIIGMNSTSSRFADTSNNSHIPSMLYQLDRTSPTWIIATPILWLTHSHLCLRLLERYQSPIEWVMYLPYRSQPWTIGRSSTSHQLPKIKR